MDTLSPKLVRRMFISSSIMMIVAVALSVLNTAQVLSAPLRTSTTVPDTIGFEGFLADAAGKAIGDGTYQITFRVRDQYDDIKWTEQHTNVQVTNGLYSVILGVTTPFGDDTFNGERWIGVTVDTLSTAEIEPRTKISSVPFALQADNAQKIGGGGVEGMVAAFDGTCPEGWTEFAAAQGRVIVGLPPNGLPGGTVGTSLSDREDRAHTHPHSHFVNTNYDITPGDSNNFIDGLVRVENNNNNFYVPYNNVVTTTSGGESSSALTSQVIPYIQLRYCKLNGS